MKLYVLFDERCAFCVRCVTWMHRQTPSVEFVFLPAGSPQAQKIFPQLLSHNDELMVISDQGAVYRGTSAWIMCLYGLEPTRELSFRLATPRLMPLARRVFCLVSENRYALSTLMNLKTKRFETQLRQQCSSPHIDAKMTC